MRLPYLKNRDTPFERKIIEFGGYNASSAIREGDFSDTMNLSTSEYPCLTVRKPRGLFKDGLTSPTALFGKGKVCYVDGTSFYYDGVAKGTVTAGKKQITSIQDKIIIFPDKAYYDISDDEFGRLDRTYSVSGTKVIFGTDTITTTGADFPFVVGQAVTISGCTSEPTNNKKVTIVGVSGKILTFAAGTFQPTEETGIIGISRSHQATGQYDATSNIYHNRIEINYTTEYMAIKNPDTYPWDLVVGEKVSVNGSASFPAANKVSAVITGKSGTKQNTVLHFADNTFPEDTNLYNITFYISSNVSFTSGSTTFSANEVTTTGDDFEFKAGDSVTVSGCINFPQNNTTGTVKSVSGKQLEFNESSLFSPGSESATVTIERAVPDMDFIMESNNRIWGCKGNSIYSSKLGDPFNFNVFQGISTDSYAVEVGTDGDFTGCAAFPTHLVFFKENFIHKIFGSKPANYQLVTSQCQGLQAGCEKSVAVLNDIMLYKSTSGIMAYLGNLPELISGNFGTRYFSEAVAGASGEKYYVSLKSGTDWEMFCFDPKRSVWLKEDHTKALDFTYLDGELLYLDGNDKKIYRVDDDTSSEKISWMAELAETTEGIMNKKGYIKFLLHMELKPESEVRVSINCDRTGWKEIQKLCFNTRKTVNIPIVPVRCDILSIRIEGRGWVKVHSLSKAIQVGSDI